MNKKDMAKMVAMAGGLEVVPKALIHASTKSFKKKGLDVPLEELEKAVSGAKGRKISYENGGEATLKNLLLRKTSPKMVPGELTSKITKGAVGPENVVHTAKGNPAINAHEIAHAKGPVGGGWKGSALYGASNTGSSIMSSIAINKGLKGKELSKKQRFLAAALALPQLAEETRANVQAAKALHRVGGKEALKSGAPALIGSQLSYLANAAAAVGGDKIVKKALKKK